MNNNIVYDYNKDEIKNNLTIDDIMSILQEWQAEPQIMNDNLIICKTICHNSLQDLPNASYKLYYYNNTSLFHCFTACGESFDIFELARKVLSMRNNKEVLLPQAIDYVARYFGYSINVNKEQQQEIENLEDWRILNNYDRIKDIDVSTQIVELKEYDETILKNLPRPILMPWIEENISQEILNNYEICYNPKNGSIIIPHRDINGRLVGVRERNLVEEDITIKGKYRPAFLNNTLYNHPLSFNLYNLNNSKENIKKFKKAIVLESEKSCLQYATMFGKENDISVACCGSSFAGYQAWLLMQLGIDEIIIGFDHDFMDVNSDTAKKIIKNLKNIQKKYGNYIKISFIWDKNNITSFKASPTDSGKEKFLTLFKERINLY